MDIASQQEIKNFLYLFKFYADCAGHFIFAERKKNLKSLAELGLTIAQAREIILQLTYINYSKGPESDVFYEGHNIWEFGQNVEDKEVYIKLSDNFDYKIAKCISFHIAKRSMTYPYKNEKGD